MKLKNITYLDLFSGIGGFSLGMQQAGVTVKNHYYAEIDKHAAAVYQHNFKQSKNLGDVRLISKRTIKHRPDLITFGFPCQDLSIAGKGAGLNGARSGLFFEAVRIIKETQPPVFIFENVKGLLSSNSGKDFETVLRTIADLRLYECEWQLVNTSWVLPQNRERVYFVGYIRGTSKQKIFPIRENENLVNKSFRKKTSPGGGVSVQPDRIANALNKRMDKMGIDDNYLKITSNKKKGYEIANSFDGIRFDHIVEKTTGRGRVKKQKAHTLDLTNTQGVLIDDEIRKFTEIECERLQGFPDNWTAKGSFNGTIKNISSTQRYKQLGNAVTVSIVELLFRRLTKNTP